MIRKIDQYSFVLFIIIISTLCNFQSSGQVVTPPSTVYSAPVFPYGGVYFRKSNPPKEDWENDYKIASELGVNVFRHWFMWAAIEVEPGIYDWEDYDLQMDLAAEIWN